MANIWREPIYDRTQEDVDFAIRKIAEWINYNISAAEYDEKVRVENEKLVLREGQVEHIDNEALILSGDGRAYIENDVLIVRIGVVYDLKGCVNVLDINRIEENIAYLSERLVKLAYPAEVSTKRWDKNNLPTKLDMQRIIYNVQSLIDSFYIPSNAPSLPETMLSYDSINAIERNIDLIKYLLDCMVRSFRKSGTFKCGSTMFLPIRR